MNPADLKTNQPKPLIDLHESNGWQDTPEIVKNCKHIRKVVNIGRCYNQFTCEECGFTYKVDSSD
jgi:transposase-like protein